MTDAEKADRLASWFKERAITPPIEYRKGEVIRDPALFVDTQLKALAMPVHTAMFRNAYMRLWQLREYLLKLDGCPQ